MKAKALSIQIVPLAMLLIFFIDSIINAIIPLPIGASGATLVSIFLIFSFLSIFNKLSIVDSTCLCTSIAILLLPCVKFFIYQDLVLSDFSDAAFLALFIMTPMTLSYAYAAISHSKFKTYSACYVAAGLILILPSFFSFEASSQSMTSTLQETSSDLEYLRGYHQGLFRLPHIASYFFLFSFIFFCIRYYQGTQKGISLILAGASCIILVYTGSRAGIFALATALIVTGALSKSNRTWTALGLLATGIIAINFYKIASLLEGSFLYQYFTLFITASENFSRLSRVIIWSSWLDSISQFGALDALFGRPFSYSFKENLYRIGSNIWFHNDWLSAIYSYGIFGLAGMSAAFASLWTCLNSMTNRNLSIVIFTACLFLSMVNGLYYYYPMLLISIIICAHRDTTIQNRRKSLQTDNNQHAFLKKDY